ncbi:MAG: sigma-70 family RNA polymerase sigma factor [Anaerolineae bacterium]
MSRKQRERARLLEREKALYRYGSALERGDFYLVSRILQGAEQDPALERLILELNRAYLCEVEGQEQAAASAWQEVAAGLQTGDVRRGEVTRICDDGAFVDLGGVEGFIHLSELSWQGVAHPSEVVEVGDEVEVYVLDVDRDRKRIGLSLKRLEPDPWSLTAEPYHTERPVEDAITDVEVPAADLTRDPVRMYLREVERIPVLGPVEEMWTAMRISAAGSVVTAIKETDPAGRTEEQKDALERWLAELENDAHRTLLPADEIEPPAGIAHADMVAGLFEVLGGDWAQLERVSRALGQTPHELLAPFAQTIVAHTYQAIRDAYLTAKEAAIELGLEPPMPAPILREAVLLAMGQKDGSYIHDYLRRAIPGDSEQDDPNRRRLRGLLFDLYRSLYLVPPPALDQLAGYHQSQRACPPRELFLEQVTDLDQVIRHLLAILKGAEDARQALVRANLRLVVAVARRHMGRGIAFLDLIQAGNLGLLEAVKRFDYAKGYPFSTYATWWIRQSISRALTDQARSIRIPAHMVETIDRLSRVQRHMVQRLGREATAEEIAVAMGMLGKDDVRAIEVWVKEGVALDPAVKMRLRCAASTVRRMMRISQEPMSPETPRDREEDSFLDDLIAGEILLQPAEPSPGGQLPERWRGWLDRLSRREREVIEMRFGLVDGRAHTLEEVAQAFGVPRERICQIERKALQKLRRPIRGHKLRD